MLKNKSAKNKTSKESLKKPEVFIMIQSNTEELKNARSATTGEKFDSLDERIDCEVDRINKKIDVTMLQQEDKENHLVENSVDGMTTDMIVKGRTLNNLLKDKIDFISSTNNTNTGYKKLFFVTKSNEPFTFIADIKYTGSSPTQLFVRGNKSDGSFVEFGSIDVANNFSGKIVCVCKQEIEKGCSSILVGFRINSDNSTIKNAMILEEDYTNKPIPDYFEGIKSFGENEGNKISILSTGKNLTELDLSNKNITPFEDGYRLDCLALYRGDEDIFDLKGKYKENTQYVLSYYGKILDNSNANNYRIRVYYTDNTYTDGVITGNKYEKRIIKTLSGKTVYKITGYYGTMNGDFIIKDVMLEEGTQATQYEPYKCDKKDILLSQYGFDEGLRGVVSVCDELNSVENKVIKKIEKYILTGNEAINDTTKYDEKSGTEKYKVFTVGISNVMGGKKSINNNFPEKIFSITFQNMDSEGLAVTQYGIYIKILKSKLPTQDTEGFKAWLKANTTTVYYALAEPIEIPLDENINVKSFNEKTYVDFNNVIKGTSSFKAPVDTVDTIVRLNRENRALEEENKTLRQDFESTTLSLTDSDLELVKQNVDMDFRLMEVEFALDIPQAILSSNIKFKNKKGEVKSMARTPYEMMKIVILSGDYDREDYIHKVGKYYERGRMTKEEHDELMSLMTADEVISKYKNSIK